MRQSPARNMHFSILRISTAAPEQHSALWMCPASQVLTSNKSHWGKTQFLDLEFQILPGALLARRWKKPITFLTVCTRIWRQSLCCLNVSIVLTWWRDCSPPPTPSLAMSILSPSSRSQRRHSPTEFWSSILEPSWCSSLPDRWSQGDSVGGSSTESWHHWCPRCSCSPIWHGQLHEHSQCWLWQVSSLGQRQHGERHVKMVDHIEDMDNLKDNSLMI